MVNSELLELREERGDGGIFGAELLQQLVVRFGQFGEHSPICRGGRGEIGKGIGGIIEKTVRSGIGSMIPLGLSGTGGQAVIPVSLSEVGFKIQPNVLNIRASAPFSAGVGEEPGLE